MIEKIIRKWFRQGQAAVISMRADGDSLSILQVIEVFKENQLLTTGEATQLECYSGRHGRSE